MAALGDDPDRLEIPILQFVHIVEGGERASMSKRRGDFVTLDELIAEIGVDATRFFMLSARTTRRSTSTSTWRQRRSRREPGLLRAVRARADRLDPAQGRGERVEARCERRRASRSTRPSAS